MSNQAKSQILEVGTGEHSVIVGRFPNGRWTYGGSASDSVYEDAEVYRVWYDGRLLDHRRLKRKAQAYRSRQIKKAQGK